MLIRQMFSTGFNRAEICYEPVTIMYIATAVMAGGQIMAGVSANQSAKEQATQQEEQGRIAQEEANRQADQKTEERRKFLAEQRMAYLANGVSLSGTPGIVQQDTWDQFTQEIDALRKSGAAKLGYYQTEANITKNTGRAQLTSGFMSGVGTLGTGYYKINS
jgi:flagellar biosynthesis component FlhA